MSDAFVWHNKNTKESAEALAKAIGASTGTVPPEGFNGDLFCVGAVPSPKFKWDRRKPSRIVNDPRKIAPFKSRESLASKVNGLGVNVRIYCVIDEEDNWKLFVKKDGEPFNLPAGAMMVLRVLVKNRFKALVQDANLTLFAVDSALCANSPENGAWTQANMSFVPMNVLFAPAIAEYEDVTQALADAYGSNAKEELQKIISDATPGEARALKALLKKMKEEL